MGNMEKKINIEAWREIFDNFLEDNGYKEEFYENLMFDGKSRESLTYEGEFVIGAFNWNSTRQSMRFWMSINEEWEDLVDNSKPVKATRLALKLYPNAPRCNNYILVEK